MKMLTVVTGILLLVPLLSSMADSPVPPNHPTEMEGGGMMVRRSDVMKTEPVADLGVARYWAVEKKNDVMCLLAEVSGTVPMHFHPDGVHRMYMLEGKMRCTIGKETMVMEAGDYMLIPRGVRHKLERVGEAKAYFVTVDSPPINPKNNVWLEPAPRKK
ncbi:MAG TPA: cupin domain-containing protein [Gemmataceae bacterium]|jgi:mannose-6-phosphate isomerase-like protein (cupin superfamily)|nr:cupin domain-containing protein [Gemmataceae bacterium]